MTGASVADGIDSEAVSYDALARPTETSLTRTSDSARLFDSRRAYDPVGNVADVWTTLPEGTDNQAFCYDEQNRLTWASSATGTVPCGGASWTAGTLASATSTNSYAYDVLNRLTSGPLGSYTYGDWAHHLDAVTAIGSTYTAAYDAAGNLTCRAPSSSTTCAGTPTGAQLSYDNEGRLSGWQNAPTSPTSTTSNLYDGEGHRVEQQVTTSGVTTTVTYVSTIEEVSTTGSTTTLTTSYYANGQRVAQAVNGVFSYLGSDGLGSAQTALDASGTMQASVLYGPYGSVRYSDGTLPGSYGFTGQRADATTGLSYYQARYYDPVAGQFASADTEQDGLNRYAYVGGNPTTASNPSGHRRLFCDLLDSSCGNGGSNPATPGCAGGPEQCPAKAQQGPTPTQPTQQAPINPLAGAGGMKGARWPDDTEWRWDKSKTLRAYMTKLERHGEGEWHINLHIQSRDGKDDYHNYHISFGGESCGEWVWPVYDGGSEASTPRDRDYRASTWSPIAESSIWLAIAFAANIEQDLAAHGRGDAGLFFELQPQLEKAFVKTAQQAGINWMI